MVYEYLYIVTADASYLLTLVQNSLVIIGEEQLEGAESLLAAFQEGTFI